MEDDELFLDEEEGSRECQGDPARKGRTMPNLISYHVSIIVPCMIVSRHTDLMANSGAH